MHRRIILAALVAALSLPAAAEADVVVVPAPAHPIAFADTHPGKFDQRGLAPVGSLAGVARLRPRARISDFTDWGCSNSPGWGGWCPWDSARYTVYSSAVTGYPGSGSTTYHHIGNGMAETVFSYNSALFNDASVQLICSGACRGSGTAYYTRSGDQNIGVAVDIINTRSHALCRYTTNGILGTDRNPYFTQAIYRNGCWPF